MIRPDDKRGEGKAGTPRPNAGRKPQSFTLKLGDAFYVWAKHPDGTASGGGMVWTVLAITRLHVDLVADNGDTWRMIR